jgi:prepilin-type N-terminal cleavage/methylation domain-containing protein/prepilin-type processing-associated H-X9-DG protein
MRAFTLVELLVVIGIIAVLIGVLLPVLSGVQSRGRDVKCKSNLRQCVQLFMVYAAENKGHLPYGHYYNQGFSHESPFDWSEKPGNNGRLITAFSLISRLSSKSYSGEDIFVNPEAVKNSAPFLRCPEAEQVLPHLCSYVVSFVAFPTPSDDYRIVSPATAVATKPMKTTDLLKESALIWDTAVVPGMATDVGYVGGADIDGQRFWTLGAQAPQVRYFSPKDPFGRIPPGLYGQNKPVNMNTGSFVWKNIDPAPNSTDGFNTYPYQGNLRFRHNKGTTCNVGFADGRVDGLTAKLNKDLTMGAQSGVPTHDGLRRYFMTKWPNGMGLKVNPGLPN